MAHAPLTKLSFHSGLTLALALLCTSTPAAAKTGTGSTGVIVVRPLSFFATDDLNFGTLLAGSTAGTVTVLPNNTRTSTGGVTPVGGGFLAARFSGFGRFNQSVNISMQATPINITRVNGTQTMQVRNFTVGSTPNTVVLTTSPQTFVIGSTSGIFSFALGAQLVVGANQTPGEYRGTYTVILNYL